MFKHSLKHTLTSIAHITTRRTMSTKKLQDKVAIVTASTDGIGFAIAKGKPFVL